MNKRDIEGNTPLMYAFKYYNEELIDLLVENGAHIHVTDLDGNTIPMLFGTYESFEKSYKLGIDFNKANKDGSTLLHIIIKNICPITKQIFELKVGCSIFEFLVKKGADINIPDGNGDTPLITAAKYNRQIMNNLIELGANVNKENSCGKTAIEYALCAQTNLLETLKVLVDNCANISHAESWLYTLFVENHLDCINYLLDAGINTDFIYQGKTLLMRLFSNEIFALTDKDTIEKLIRLSDLTIEDEHGHTAHDYYIKTNNPDPIILRALRSAELKSSRNI